jgi:predicted ATPase/alpha/beta superfamily hydrolase
MRRGRAEAGEEPATIIMHPHRSTAAPCNKVVTILERGHAELGLRTLRFNFRGVGQSEASTTTATRPTDLFAVAEWVAAHPPGRLFGWAAFLRLHCDAGRAEPRRRPARSPSRPGAPYAFDSLRHPECPWLVVQGDEDGVVNIEAVLTWANALKPPDLVIMKDADHFFHRRILVCEACSRTVCATSCRNPPLRLGRLGFVRVLPLFPLSRYRQLIDGGSFSPDPDQLTAAEALDELWHGLQRQPRTGRLLKFLPGRKYQAAHVKGLYLWGGVGRGKTWLMDLFHDSLPAGRKQRTHFHRFMQRVHRELRGLGNVQDPLPRIAADWAARCRVLCLDEFFVADIADAMLLAGLLDNLFVLGVTLVTTSNTAPDGLYRDGLQRARFLPAIETDQATHAGTRAAGRWISACASWSKRRFFTPLDAHADRVMTRAFERFAADCELDRDLDVNGRNFTRVAARRRRNLVRFRGTVRKAPRQHRLHRNRPCLQHGRTERRSATRRARRERCPPLHHAGGRILCPQCQAADVGGGAADRTVHGAGAGL